MGKLRALNFRGKNDWTLFAKCMCKSPLFKNEICPICKAKSKGETYATNQ
jgi:hypothetical protein